MDIRRGLCACALFWAGGGISFPLVNMLSRFSPGELLFARGFAMAAPLLLVFGYSRFVRPDGVLLLGALFGALGGVTTFFGARAWGVGKSLLVTTAAPILVAMIAIRSGRRCGAALLLGMAAVLAGTACIVLSRPHASAAHDTSAGFLWGIASALTVALHWECMGRSRSAVPERMFWIGSMGVLVGLVFIAAHGDSALPSILSGQKLEFWTLALFCFVNGTARFWAAGEMTIHLPPEACATLANGEVLCAFAGAALLLGERLSSFEQAGGVLILGGSIAVSRAVRAREARRPGS